MTSVPERYFYHSFPRRSRNHSIDVTAEVEKGLAILRSMKKMGLLLTPETIEWPVVLADGALSETWKVTQKRCSFTELAPAELSQHAQFFGDFALEFEIRALRTLGAIPVFYLPRPSKTSNASEELATAFVAGIGEIDVLLDRLRRFEKLVRSNVNKDDKPPLTKDSRRTLCTVGGIEDLRFILTEGIQPLIGLQATFRALSGFFYFTEDLKYTDLLGYYRQREWRILANMAEYGIALTRELDTCEKDSLLEIDPDFFSRQLTFRTGTFRRVDQCRLFKQMNGKPFIQHVRRVIVPEVAVAKAKDILNESSDPQVVALESLNSL
jgi:hypothetical protein